MRGTPGAFATPPRKIPRLATESSTKGDRTREAAAMKTTLACAAALALSAVLAGRAGAAAPEAARWAAEAKRVTITRDNWGIAHVHGHTDADAVFGMIYAQAEDDFPRVEANYLTALGWTAKAKGEDAVWQDLRQRLYLDPEDLKAKYAAAPGWLRALMDAWADGLNYWLATNPGAHPQVITHFEPWMTLAFSEGSIGGDIERIDLKALQAFYDHPRTAEMQGAASAEMAAATAMPTAKRPGLQGSNGIAIAPKNTLAGHALLLINPHTSFYFRSELQMSSDQGLDAYGAATWGQFFVYQGFNPHVGWMHTSSGVDNVDQFAETITPAGAGGAFTYAYGAQQRPVAASTIAIDFKKADGSIGRRTFTVYRTHHGPIVREAGGKWIAMDLMNTPVKALEQSFLRTKARDYAGYMKVAALMANSSNNTLFADDKGDIAYLHPQFVPMRDDRFDYTHVVDGSNPAADWKGLTPLDKLPSVVNPKGGFVINTNNWPYSVAGPDSPLRSNFPKYMDRAGENPRGVHALLVVQGRHDLTLVGLMHGAYDSYLPAFADLIPPLVSAWDALPKDDPQKTRLAQSVAELKTWDRRWALESPETTLASFWGDDLATRAKADPDEEGVSLIDRMVRTSPQAKLAALAAAQDRLVSEFGSRRVPWGEINRFQRLTDDIAKPNFNDADASIPVPFTTSRWGSLAAYEARPYPGTKKWYGTSGNSFVAVVEFGPRVHARAVTAGGESGHPGSPHFDDEAQRYAGGNLREVYFWPDELKGHVERTYRPGE
jgi:acyl-homoserine-lactone acylase